MTRAQAAQKPKAELDVALRLRQAMEAHRQNKFSEAERGYGAVLDAAPDCFEALHFLGLAYLQQNKLAEALDLVSRALKSKPQSTDSLAMRGVVLSNLGRHADALENHDALLALRPDSAETHYNRGVCLAKLGQHEEAVASYRQSIALKPGNPQVFHNLGNSLIELAARRRRSRLMTERSAMRSPVSTRWSIAAAPCSNSSAPAKHWRVTIARLHASRTSPPRLSAADAR